MGLPPGASRGDGDGARVLTDLERGAVHHNLHTRRGSAGRRSNAEPVAAAGLGGCVAVKFKGAGLPLTAMVWAAGTAPPADLGKRQRCGGSGDRPGIDLEMYVDGGGTVSCPGRSHDDAAVVTSRSQFGSIDANGKDAVGRRIAAGRRDGEPRHRGITVGHGGVIQRLARAADSDGLRGRSGPAEDLVGERDIGGTQSQRSVGRTGHIQRDQKSDGAIGDGCAAGSGRGDGDGAGVGARREPGRNH